MELPVVREPSVLDQLPGFAGDTGVSTRSQTLSGSATSGRATPYCSNCWLVVIPAADTKAITWQVQARMCNSTR